MEDVVGQKASRFSFITFSPWSGLDFLSPMVVRNGSKRGERSLRRVSTSVSRRLSICSDWSIAPFEKLNEPGKTHKRQATPLFLRQPNNSRTSLIDTGGKVVIPAQVHLDEKSSESSRAPSTRTSSVSDQQLIKPKSWPYTSCKAQGGREGIRKRIVDAYRKNYCPRRVPNLVFPTGPTNKEKYSYLDMKRNYLVICGTVAVLSLAIGGWMMAKADPIYAWYAVFIFVTQFYLFVSFYHNHWETV